MRKLVCILSIFLFSFHATAQLTAKFTVREAKKLCYTGDISRNTTATFKNNSSAGDYWYVWNYGDGSADSTNITYKVTDLGKHNYRTDGLYSVELYVIDPEEISDEITNSKVKAVRYISALGSDSVKLAITYKAETKDSTAEVHIASSKFARTRSSNLIEVFSPYVSGPSFTYEIDDPSSEEHKAGLGSFIYVLSVNTDNFKPHQDDIWSYYWSIYEEKTLVSEFCTNDTEYRYKFPKENYKPGYTVNLKIALDSTKFDAFEIDNNDLQECVASQSIQVKVTDHFYTDSTRTKDKLSDRKPAIPNVFTPGGGDENDVFYFSTNGINEFSIWIYNNNGTLVYHQKALNISWTGVDDYGHECPSGTYYYVVKSSSKDKRHNTAGQIHLFRQN